MSAATYAFKYPTPPSGAAPSRSGKSHDDIFQAPVWRDLWAAVLYYISLAAFFTIAGINIHYLFSQKNLDIPSEHQPLVNALLISMAPALLSSALLSCLALFLIYKFPEGMIHGSFLGTTGLIAASGVFSLIQGSAVGGIISLIIAGLNLLLYFMWRKYIPFSAVLLQWTSHTIVEYPSMILANVGVLILLILKSLVFFASLAGGLLMMEDNVRTKGYFNGTLYYSLFWMLWTEEILQNVSRVTSSGVFACRYFLGLHSPQAPNPTSESFKRATTYSFGSICFGSLMVAIITFLRSVLNMSDDRDSSAAAILDCLLSIIENLLRYFNTYAFTQVAIYGKPYIEAAKSTWELVKAAGIDAIINDNLIGSVLSLSSLFIGLIGGTVALVTFIFYSRSAEPVERLFAFLIGLFASSIISWCSLAIISSGVTTFFVCLAEDPAALQRSDPATYQNVRSQYSFLNL